MATTLGKRHNLALTLVIVCAPVLQDAQSNAVAERNLCLNKQQCSLPSPRGWQGGIIQCHALYDATTGRCTAKQCAGLQMQTTSLHLLVFLWALPAVSSCISPQPGQTVCAHSSKNRELKQHCTVNCLDTQQSDFVPPFCWGLPLWRVRRQLVALAVWHVPEPAIPEVLDVNLVACSHTPVHAGRNLHRTVIGGNDGILQAAPS